MFIHMMFIHTRILCMTQGFVVVLFVTWFMNGPPAGANTYSSPR